VILEDTWSPQLAASRLLELVGGDLGSLRRARGRVLEAAMERSTPVTGRALATLDVVLGPVVKR
jgi:hypothetical protein